MRIILSTARRTSFALTPGGGVRKMSEVQSTSLIKGYETADSLPAAVPTASSFYSERPGPSFTSVGLIGCCLTVFLKLIKPS